MYFALFFVENQQIKNYKINKKLIKSTHNHEL
jgi:hypothetical protein